MNASDWPRVDISPDVLGLLGGRIGLFALRQRLFQEQLAEPKRDWLHRLPVEQLLPLLLRATRLYARGERNAVDVELVNHNAHVLAPGSRLEGYRILQLSDLHCENFPQLIEVAKALIAPLDYDLCLLTGDFAFRHNAVDDVIPAVAELAAVINAPTYAILGNHDSINLVPALEALGIRFLLNESISLQHNGETFRLAGVDDCVYYDASNLEQALSDPGVQANPVELGTADAGGIGVNDQTLLILMNHSPLEYQKAAVAGVDLYLTGHTHGGQVCLPGGVPVARSSTRRGLLAGPWRFRQMIGYTNRGMGSSMVRVRFNCRPEITVHQLRTRAQAR